MKRRKTIALTTAVTVGWAFTEFLPRWAWKRSVTQDSETYDTTVDFIPDWTTHPDLDVHDLDVTTKQVQGLAYHRADRQRLLHTNGLSMELLYLEYEAGNPRYFEDLFLPSARAMHGRRGEGNHITIPKNGYRQHRG